MQHEGKLFAATTISISAVSLVAFAAWANPRWGVADAHDALLESNASVVLKTDIPLEGTLSGVSTPWKSWLGKLYDVSSVPSGLREIAVKDSGGALEVSVPRFNRPERFDVEANVSWNEDRGAGECGLVLGVSHQARYAFTVTSNGRAAVNLIQVVAGDGPRYETLSIPGVVRTAKRSSADELLVKVRGQNLGFYVNGQRVAQIEDPMITDDWVIGVLAQGHRDVILDNLFATVR